MSDKPTDETAQAPTRHIADEALRELEALAAAWSERQRTRLKTGRS